LTQQQQQQPPSDNPVWLATTFWRSCRGY
jgi:hypothetical protein